MFENRKAICDELTDGKLYTKIEDIQLFAGDSHNHGRSVTVLHTDAGRLVYKPRDVRGDRYIRAVADRFFSEFTGIPKCVAFGDSFGVCEYIEKQRPDGEKEAKDFWYHAGGMALFAKLLGSIDMHIENLTCRDGKPYLIDLETALFPVVINDDFRMRHPELRTLMTRSPYLSGLLPGSMGDIEMSVLLNTSEEGCAPTVNGAPVSVMGYFECFMNGYQTAYSRAMENRQEIAGMIRAIPDKMPVRMLLRNTQTYANLMPRLFHHTALCSKEGIEKTDEVLSKILSSKTGGNYGYIIGPEIEAMRRGDIPYIYTFAGSRAVYMDGKLLQDNVFETSAKEHALDNLRAMSDKDALCDRRLIERALEQYPEKTRKSVHGHETIIKSSAFALLRDTAACEAGKLLEKAFSLNIPSPEGRLFWGYINDDDRSFSFCTPGLANGISGFAVFAAACSFACGDERTRLVADRIIDELFLDLRRMLFCLPKKDCSFDCMPALGEADGIGGIIAGLELLEKYAPHKKHDDIIVSVDHLLERVQYQRYGAPDRMIGLSGLLSALCRIDRYRDKRTVIRRIADRLLETKTFECKGRTLWVAAKSNPRPLSGAGHGQAGIAEALYAASRVLDDKRYADAAAEALAYECDMYETYGNKYGTWADLRSYPPEGYVHGYCSGAPGIGIMMERIKCMGYEDEVVKRLARCARASTDRLSLNERDHLCCGNSAIAEYHLSVGDHASAGRVLRAMYDRRKAEGSYRYMGYDRKNSLTPSLFYGVSGVGYEMLRYAFPEKIKPVL
jgi:lantibiotic modifying enzyme